MPRGFADPNHLAMHGHKGGRPKGSSNLLARELKARLSDYGPDLLDKAIKLAMRGDVTMLSFLLGRLLPVAKAVDQPVALELPTPEQPINNLGELASYLFRAVASGHLAVDHAEKLGRLVAVMAKLPEPGSLERIEHRLAVLEGGSDLPIDDEDIEPPIESPATAIESPIGSPAIESPIGSPIEGSIIKFPKDPKP